MRYRKFKADQLFDGFRFHKEKILITDQSGKIEAIADADGQEDVESFDGILTPGLINCHCHLELSHLKDVIPPHTGLIEFLCTVVTKRKFDADVIQAAIVNAEKEMYENGIVAVGDICNTDDTVNVKSKSMIAWQNFVEVLSFTDEEAYEHISHYKEVAGRFIDHKVAGRSQRISLVPHAPYSISPSTFRMLNDISAGHVISMHNQEHPAEDELYRTGKGEYLKLFNIFGMAQSPFPVTGNSSIRSVLPYFNKGQTIFLVHNTFMPSEDISWANDYAQFNGLKLVYCFCINANLYIENKVPTIDNFIEHNSEIVLGTDSYSSNWQLSIAKEIQSFSNRFPGLSLETLLKWATSNGAKALRWEDKLGSFEKGKTPGIVLLDVEKGKSKRLI